MVEDTQQQKKNRCAECDYFNGVGKCHLNYKPTTATAFCHAQLYEFVHVCETEDCSVCQHLLKSCIGDRNKPPRRLLIHPHIGQKRIIDSTANIIAFIAGSQSGKTSIAPYWLYQEMKRCGNGDYLVVSPTYPLQDKKLLPVYLEFFVDILKIGHYKVAKRILEIDGDGLKCSIFFGSAEKPESLESATALAVHLDEAGQDKFKLSAWDAINRRISRNQGRILITTTPYNFNWLYTEVYMRWQNGNPEIEVIQFDSKDSPGFSKRKYMQLKETMPTWKFDMFMRGLFSRPAGQIYSDFDENVHLIKPFPIPEKWNWHVGIDPGPVHTALVWVAEEPGANKYYIVHSYLDESRITTKEHVKKAMRLHEYSRVVRWVGGAGSEEQFRLDWKAEGIHVREPEISDVESGIDRIITLLRGKCVFIFDNDENTTSEDKNEMTLVEEFRSYSRELDDNGKATDKIANKKKYHKLDGCRYVFSAMGSISDYSAPVYFQNNTVPISAKCSPDFLKRGAIPHF